MSTVTGRSKDSLKFFPGKSYSKPIIKEFYKRLVISDWSVFLGSNGICQSDE